MMQPYTWALSFLAACSTATILSAQAAPQPQTPPRPATPTAAPEQPSTKSDAQAGMTTVSGCLKMEKDVAGAKPGMGGMGDGFMLTDVKMGGGTSGGGAAMSGAGHDMASMMYKVGGLSNDELKKHANHRVELQGRVDEGGGMMGGSAKPGSGMADGAKPKEFRATALKMVSATCTPASY